MLYMIPRFFRYPIKRTNRQCTCLYKSNDRVFAIQNNFFRFLYVTFTIRASKKHVCSVQRTLADLIVTSFFYTIHYSQNDLFFVWRLLWLDANYILIAIKLSFAATRRDWFESLRKKKWNKCMPNQSKLGAKLIFLTPLTRLNIAIFQHLSNV